MSPTDTITALSSGWGHSRRALVRLSGPRVPELLSTLLRPAPTHPWTIGLTAFRLTDTLDLPCLASRFDPPRSFTGEPCAEIIVPGNPILIERVLARLTSTIEGVREAQPGEFSARAYLNGKMTLDQAEGIAATIAAQTDHQLAAAEALLQGRTGRRYVAWADELATLLALVEAGIDFTDQEDVVPIPPPELSCRVAALHAAVEAHLGDRTGREQSSLLPRVVLVGLPNAGKSTLFNALLGRRRAVESPIAGTTRDALIEPLDLAHDCPGGGQILLIDLPGLDQDAADPIDRDAQRQASEAIEQADILLLCDPRAEWRFAAPTGRPTLRVRTKADLPMGYVSGVAHPATIGVCALDGWNLATLRRAIADATWNRTAADSTRPFLLPRHRRGLVQLARHLATAAGLIDVQAHSLAHPETLATELRAGLDELAELTGQISPDDILGRIFATFCVGK